MIGIVLDRFKFVRFGIEKGSLKVGEREIEREIVVTAIIRLRNASRRVIRKLR